MFFLVPTHFQKYRHFFQLAKIPWICKSSYYDFHKKYLKGVTNEACNNEKETKAKDKDQC